MRLSDINTPYQRAVLHPSRKDGKAKKLIREDGECLRVSSHKLSRDEVVELIGHLERWVEHGYL